MFPSSTKSSTPMIVTVCGVFQFAVVKVKLDVETVPSATLLEEIPTTTFEVGFDVSAIVNDELPPASVVVRPEVGVTVKPAVSSSVLLTETSLPSRPL